MAFSAQITWKMMLQSVSLLLLCYLDHVPGQILNTMISSTSSLYSGTLSEKLPNASIKPSTIAGNGYFPDPLDRNVAKSTGDAYHMKKVRFIHSRVENENPVLMNNRFVSSTKLDENDVAKAYRAGLDTVNTFSIEGALRFVQAECINSHQRPSSKRCERKYGARNLVFYSIEMVQSNESISQFAESWKVNEYGPLVPMKDGQCEPLNDKGKLPVECYQFSGEYGQPNVGPFVGANAITDTRAPYPGAFMFSFPNSCPTKSDLNKTEDCRNASRSGLCDLGIAPNGVDCTFAYSILGWVPIDDVVGITSIVNERTGSPYANFSDWCNASESHVEFAADNKTGTFEQGLSFWRNSTNEAANEKRFRKVIETYTEIYRSQTSQQIPSSVIAHFRPLPTIDELTARNPPCYHNVKQCGSGNGCKRNGYVQVCQPCKAGEYCDTGNFTFPILAKAKAALSEEETITPALRSFDASQYPTDVLDATPTKAKRNSASYCLPFWALVVGLAFGVVMVG
uniref:Uncharacterized protein AlNc14C127G6838 n=1 Tax=Albugo laibachii Nc14 TaxID=890382 RepID=F0WJX2_9STRA|nr:putative GPIanchored serinethreonine rich hypothetical protein [Albugo laibachii Nc14]CCA24265.1 putative GPIanchored serinethreonine rich hypothetical protein [Albugo laibachii Nc14]|eukprot:CCA24265.1 putative GPIanchored serinethreonine rich hypothetical protein [Albugo laibachii Nc14]